MKVLIVNTMAPFIWGGAEELSVSLADNLRARDHDVELLRLPFSWEPYDRIPDEIMRFSMMRLPNVDKVISLKFPAYFLPAQNHTTWLIHQYRQAYDLWETDQTNIPNDEHGRRVRQLIVDADRETLSARRIFTISQIVSDRLHTSVNVSAAPLRAPINDPELFGGGEPQGYLLAAGRVNAAKRQHLIVEAMAHLPQSLRLIVAGPPDSPEDAARLQDVVQRLDLADRVKLDLRFLDRRELADYVNAASAVVYVPYNEDSFGYVTMEAYQAAKPVITVADAGEVLELVIDGETGAVSTPDGESLAAAIASVLISADRAAEMGRAGQAHWLSKDVNWSSNIAQLMAE